MKTIKGKILVVLAAFLLAGAAFALGTGVHLVANSTSAAPTLYSQDTITSIYNNATPAVVEINVTQTVNTGFGSSTQAALGSGFLIDTRGIS
jgi:S1-C subfamily serine protease